MYMYVTCTCNIAIRKVFHPKTYVKPELHREKTTPMCLQKKPGKNSQD